VFRASNSNVATFRADYATHADFCDVFGNDANHLFLLAFLLTANHEESERCFVSTLDEAFNKQAVFKEWVRSWVTRRLIENAIEIVWHPPAKNQKRDLWRAEQLDIQKECEVDTVTKLAPFERFVFVMSILEGYSNWECSLLLGSSMKKVAQARLRALRRLSDGAAFLARGDALPISRLGVTSNHPPSFAGIGY
jgi:hypothetical protein